MKPRPIRAHYSTAICAIATFTGLACGADIQSRAGFQHPEYGGAKRASYELECPPERLEVVELEVGTMGVSGCGKKAIYKWVYGAGWVNNSGSENQAKR